MKKLLLLPALFLLMSPETQAVPAKEPPRVTTARKNVAPRLKQYFGRPVFIRIIKENALLELWLKKDGAWKLFKTYRIAGMSGELGPKTARGDEQAPEGFYRVFPHSMNPYSNYHLSFNIGYPNKYDKKLGRTGSLIMVHGSNVSIGCFAMTDSGIEEIYTLINEAFRAGVPSVPVQIYPFRMTPERMNKEKKNIHYPFWKHLLPGWKHTEKRHEPYRDSDSI